MFSSFCIATYGDNRYVDQLRILTAIELYLHSDFYSTHPCFYSLCETNSDIFDNIDSILAMSVSHDSLDSGKIKAELVKQEAMHICDAFKWSGFLCVLALASVCSSRVQCYYKNIGSLVKYRLIFSQLISPRLLNQGNTESIHLLFCYSGIDVPVPFKHNHYVPLPFCSGKNKPCGKRKAVLEHQKKGKFRKTNAGQSYISSFMTKSSPDMPPSVSCCTSSVVSTVCAEEKVSNVVASSNSSVPDTSVIKASPSIVSDREKVACSVVSSVDLSKKDLFEKGSSAEHFYISDVSTYDVSTYSYREKASQINDSKRKDLIRNVFVPDADFSFPKTNSRNFKFCWFKNYPWSLPSHCLIICLVN